MVFAIAHLQHIEINFLRRIYSATAKIKVFVEIVMVLAR